MNDREQQRQAHEQPVIFYSLVIGFIGPVLLVTVPPVRKSLGWRPAEPIPTSYPGEFFPIPTLGVGGEGREARVMRRRS